jgi:spermidine synthase
MSPDKNPSAQENPVSLNESWLSEKHEPVGSAFSLKATKIHEEQTPFQTIAIYGTEHYGRVMTIDGCFMLTGRDNFVYHEMMTHPALMGHPDPRRVVIIGGGDCGSLQETLKHACVERVVQVDIDERVTRLSERYFPELCTSNADTRAELLFADGIEYVKQAQAGSLDVIIVDSTDPVGPAEGLFREPFYRDCHRALRGHGLLVQQSESPLLHAQAIIKPMHEAMRRAGFGDTATLHFPLSCYPSGWWTATLAVKDGRVPAAPVTTRASPRTRYYNAAIHHACFATPQFLSDLIET